MKIDQVSANRTIQKVEELLEAEKTISPALKVAIKLLVEIMSLLMSRLNVNSKNSSKPPSEDRNRDRGSNRKKSDKKPGGQNGHIGTKLKKTGSPDKIEQINIDKSKLPKGKYREVGYESRQVFDINITRVITEYRAQILEDQNGNRFVAEFPPHVNNEVQYGTEAKVNSIYMSQFQLVPYQRIQDQFTDQMNLPLSTGSIFNFNKECYELLDEFDAIAKQQLVVSELLNVDETGINVNKKGFWLHTASNDTWTYFYPHEKRGSEATDDIGILPKFDGVLCHDHWKSYYKYNCTHSLCNAHHIRELTFAEEQDHQLWAKTMRELLLKINNDVNNNVDNILDKDIALRYREQYRKILESGDIECPEPIRKDNQKGRLKKSKSRNLLERLRNYEDDTLRFMENKIVPFTNNLGENDLRMTKVQQKISGCFRSIDGAYIFCRIRSYLSTCRKNNVGATEALRLLFHGKMPDFINEIKKNE
jgi:transposase